MTAPLATYSFLPWLKGGLANQITAADGANVLVRASIDVDLVVGTDNPAIPVAERTVTTSIQLVGPGDIIGINPDVVVRTEPRDWITDFEPNYVPCIEFYDEDFLWRYTPAGADSALHRLRPWIALVVLRAGEFEELRARTRPLPAIRVADAQGTFPDPAQLWAWAHVHINEDITAGRTRDVAASMVAFEQLVAAYPDRAYSRLICPRRLEAETDYYAFLIPTFESGRLAGLGLPIPAALRATENAWGVNAAITDYPIYYRWYFRTGTTGDFEYLVRLLEPKPMDARVGVREMDAHTPGLGVSGLADDIRLEGALKCPPPGGRSTNWPNPYPHPFQTSLLALLNAPAEYERVAPGSDPIVVPPIYGGRHALVNRLRISRRNWVHEMNLDPRHRVPAGFGTEVVQDAQDRYMQEAWRQVGDVLAANAKIRNFQAGLAASLSMEQKSVATLPAGAAIAMTAPVHGRVLASETDVFGAALGDGRSGGERATVARRLDAAILSRTMLTPAFRRVVRPRGTVFTRAGERGPAPESWVERANNGDITATPTKVTPAGLVDNSDTTGELAPAPIPGWLRALLQRPVLLVLLVIVLIVLFLAVAGIGALAFVLIAAVLAAAVVLWRWWTQRRRQEDAARRAGPAGWTRATLATVPPAPDFRITESGSAPSPTAPPSGGPGADSPDAADFRIALSELFELFEAVPPEAPPRATVQIGTTTTVVLDAIDPRNAHLTRLDAVVKLSPDLRGQWSSLPRTVLAYPEMTEPMYRPLAAKSNELLLPNIGLITPNTISLLITNQRFIEAYMVGVNHEFMRELLWREYPTDRMGSPFRQFWDVSNHISIDPTVTPDQLRERLKDIPPIHAWPDGSALGTHNHREQGGDTAQLVLVIRGDVLKKYPNTVISANRALWERRDDGSIDRTRPRGLDSAADAQRYPLYGATVPPDIHFLGFDLTVEEARGGTGASPTDPAGWFFVLQERPGEPRFGLDLPGPGAPAPLDEWDDLSWGHVALQNGHISLSTTVTLRPPPPGQDNNPERASWSPNTNAADLAHVLHQDPVLVAVHAAEMLRDV